MYRSGDLDLGAITFSEETGPIGVAGVIQRWSRSRNPGELDPLRGGREENTSARMEIL